jgi:hypothetical protein
MKRLRVSFFRPEKGLIPLVFKNILMGELLNIKSCTLRASLAAVYKECSLFWAFASKWIQKITPDQTEIGPWYVYGTSIMHLNSVEKAEMENK